MKNLLLFLFLSLVFNVLCAQNSSNTEVKKERIIYLWDVTLSTKGYNGSQDIYDDVVEFLTKQIDGFIDPNTDVYVIPFQDKTLETWHAKTDAKGKKKLIEKIENYKNDKVTKTNISGPMEYAVDNLIDSTRRNLLYVLTDGLQNYPSKESGMEILLKYLKESEWSKKCDESYMYYFAMTREAVDPRLSNVIEPDSSAKIILPDYLKMQWLDLDFPKQLNFNIKEESVLNMTLSPLQKIAIPSGLKVRLTLQDSPFKLDEVVDVKNSIVSVKLNDKYVYDELKTQIGEEEFVTMRVELLGGDDVKNNSNVFVKMCRNTVSLRLINRPEKRVVIKLRPQK